MSEEANKNSEEKPKKTKKRATPAPNTFLFDSFTRSMVIYNFMLSSEILKIIGIINNKKKWREQVVNEWLENMKKNLQSMVNDYASQEKMMRKMKKKYGLPNKIETTEDLQQQGIKNLKEFSRFLEEMVLNRELDKEEGENNEKD